MIDREYFKSQLEWLRDRDKREEGLNDAIKALDPDSLSFIGISGEWQYHFVDLLSKATNDKSEWISYWIYELEWGMKAEKDSVRDKDNKPIPIKTMDNLYDLITSNTY